MSGLRKRNNETEANGRGETVKTKMLTLVANWGVRLRKHGRQRPEDVRNDLKFCFSHLF